MKKAILAIVSMVVISFASQGQFKEIVSGSINKNIEKAMPKNMDSEKIKEIVKEMENRNIEDIPDFALIYLGVTYEVGMPEIGIKKDLKKAIKYFDEAGKRKIAYGYIREGFLLLNEKKFNEAKIALKKGYRISKRENDKFLSLYLLGLCSLQEEDYKNTYYFFKQVADKYNAADASMVVAFIKNFGVGVSVDEKEADFYLNKACTNKNAELKIKMICNDPKIVEYKQ